MIVDLTGQNVCATVVGELIASMVNLLNRVVPGIVDTGARDYSILRSSKCQ